MKQSVPVTDAKKAPEMVPPCIVRSNEIYKAMKEEAKQKEWAFDKKVRRWCMCACIDFARATEIKNLRAAPGILRARRRRLLLVPMRALVSSGSELQRQPFIQSNPPVKRR